ncbi:thiol-disulfide oxidoreductase ResA [Cytobacillus gottheilii]|uniref:Thiol-disulfide oxidoreductase ResA n=1 Tax=Cytobacillus gottheilii TaxID=859144 RepID=A0ABX8F7V8_9BACI|nr:thiol-disulfide oxidoreductase ResA [Cytobacillus gottheilii]QVY60214.1 thiol-disulfide oxidoreductase ResA [Cytobacillus gottheilii]
MKKKRLVIRTVILLLLGAAVAYTLYANFSSDDIRKVAINEKAPDFVLTDMEGNKHQLSDYEGQGVFLNFWGTWCKPCEKEMPYMNNQYKQFKEQGVQVLAVNINESDFAVNKFTSRYNLDFPIVIDKGEVMEAYGIGPLPTTFLVDKDGIVIKRLESGMTEAMIKGYMEEIKP